MDDWLKTSELDERQVRGRMYRAPTAPERERWHAVWLELPDMEVHDVPGLETALDAVSPDVR